MKKLILIAIVTTIVFSGCKKYKEGPLISFRSVEKRITGTWQIIEFTSNGVDSLQYYNDSCGSKVVIGGFRNGDGSPTSEHTISFKGGKKEFFAIFYFESSNKMRVLFRSHENGNFKFIGPIVSDIASYWEILRLKKDELKVTIDFDNRNYIISLKK